MGTAKRRITNSHGGYGGPQTQELIAIQLDKLRKGLEDWVVEHGAEFMETAEYNLRKGRYEGMAAALGMIRKTKMSEEIRRSNERLGID